MCVCVYPVMQKFVNIFLYATVFSKMKSQCNFYVTFKGIHNLCCCAFSSLNLVQIFITINATKHHSIKIILNVCMNFLG